MIFWPYLWLSPINNFIFAFQEMANFEIETFNLFFRNLINAKDVPWYFIPTWMIITTPILYTGLFFIGLFKIFQGLIKNKILNLNQNNYIDIFFISTLFGPLLAVILFDSTLYNGWRQMYFIYPSFVFVCTICINFFYNMKFIPAKKFLLFLLTIYFLNILSWIIINHPHQYVYFNETINKKNIHQKFDLDYWGLSYKENFEYIINNDHKDQLKIYNLSSNKLFYPLFSIEENLRKRFVIVKSINDADYVFNNFFMIKNKDDKKILKHFKIINEVLVDNYSINTLYKKINF